MGVHSFEKLGAKMGAHSFFWQRVRVVRHTKNMGAINSLENFEIRYLANTQSPFSGLHTDIHEFHCMLDALQCGTYH